MLTGHKQQLWEQLAATCSREELVWINGFLSGLLHEGKEADAPVTPAAPVQSGRITIAYGTETGNAKKLATDFAARAKKNQVPVKLVGLDQYRLTDITREENLFVIISTQGDGEPPVAAQKFYDHIHLNGFRLDSLRYGVLALGDTAYPLFCKTGEDVDAQLQKLGGKRVLPIRKCDLDYETDAAQWFDEVLRVVSSTGIAVQSAAPVAAPVAAKAGRQLYEGTVLSHINLHDDADGRETFHIELDIAQGITYQPGDSVAIVPENDPELVQQLLAEVHADPQKTVAYKEQRYTIRDLLLQKLSVTHLHERTVKKYADTVGQDIPDTKADLLDLLRIYPVKDISQFEAVLQVLPLQAPRIYNIASSPAAHGNEVHLTVKKDVFTVEHKPRTGVCSAYLQNLAVAGKASFFIQQNKRFRLPAENNDILMIGPGTGIAAFRSFLSERDATGATGRNWLFFGEDRFVSDFLYQTEIQNWYETGVLTRLSLAFAKDRPYGMYVQHRLLQEGKAVFEWIAAGAYVYVCGEKTPMGTEVEHALLNIIERFGGLPAADAAAYFENMKKTGRYCKDLY